MDLLPPDSPIADFIGTYDGDSSPPAPSGQMGQINAYTGEVFGTDQVHIELYNHILQSPKCHLKSKFAPFSHDAEGAGDGDGPGPVVPEPSTIVLAGVGLLGLGLYGWRRRRRQA